MLPCDLAKPLVELSHRLSIRPGEIAGQGGDRAGLFLEDLREGAVVEVALHLAKQVSEGPVPDVLERPGAQHPHDAFEHRAVGKPISIYLVIHF